MTVKVDYSSAALPDELGNEFETSLRRLRSEKPPVEEHIVGGVRRSEGEIFERFDPCVPAARVSAAYAASSELVTEAVTQARRAFQAWRHATVKERCEGLLQAAEQIRADLAELSAIVSAETGKTRLEAIGEVQEAADIVKHYCGLMQDNAGYNHQLKSSPTEDTYDVLVPYGVFGVIAPFNFPFALPTGMMVGALVAGNTVICKPSDKTPRSTGAAASILADALPPGVVNLVHGGADVGRGLVETDVDGIAFTGSAEVGWEIVAATGPLGLPRPVLAEMGGQNPAVVGATADLDAAVAGIVRSAFGLSGQKCSACRRVIVVREVADALTSKIVERAEQLLVGDPVEISTDLGPVIDGAIAARLDEALRVAGEDGRVLTGGRLAQEGNWFSPIVVADLPVGHPLTREELFGPLLTITQVDAFQDALAEANDVPYGLSAGVFSGEQAELDQFVDQIEAGVIYVNRAAGATTGAWPGVQSFCGWKRSGSAGKGGLGHWYIQGFMREQSRTIAHPAS
jgi:1-pyrroline-5-carboxylate dehydrogenase